jgi:BirA family biotin operon repressor/biotin-[acetyl-CoA-carboxylase] ligase
LLPQTPLNPVIGQPFIVLSRIDSSNNYAMAQAHAGLAKHGTTWFAHEQTRGKGQRGKSWIASPGENIIQSILIDPSAISITKTFHLSLVISLACYDLFKKYAGEGTSIKWPNDVYWNDRKAGGILIENIFRGLSWSWAIAGIGININQDPSPLLAEAISLKEITGKKSDAVALGKELCGYVGRRIQMYLHSSSSTMHEYNQVLYKRGKKVRLKKESAVFETTITGVNENGQLLTIDSMDRTFDFGEVEWIK